MVRKNFVRLVAVFSVLAVIAGLAPAVNLPSLRPLDARATTPDADVAGMVAGLNQFTTFSQGLAGDGLLGQNLPGLTLAPGGAAGAGLNDLLANVFSSTRLGALTHCADFANLGTGSSPLTPSSGRSIAVTVGPLTCGSTSTSDTLPLVITENRDVTASLALSQTGGQFSLNSSGGLTLHVVLTLNLQFVYVPSQNYFYLVKDLAGTTPALNLAIDGVLADNSTLTASLGILGVTATATGTSFHAHLTATVNDPAGHGRLAFSDPVSGGGTTAGELTPTNAPSIFTIGWNTGTGVANTIAGTFAVVASPDSSIGLGALTSVAGTVVVNGANLATSAPTLTLTGFDPTSALMKFENLTPRDLGDGLAHLAAALTAIQSAKVNTLGDINLPFMQGKLSDAIKLGENLLRFLAGPDPLNHPELGAVDQKSDTPRFASIQQMLEQLTAMTGADGVRPFSVAGVTFEDTTSKLVINFSIDRSTTIGAPLDPGPTTAYPTGSISANSGVITSTTVTDLNAVNWTPNEWAGFDVRAGGVTASIQSSTATALTLKVPTGASTAWSGATPSGPYTIVTKDPGVGRVNLANALSGTAGILTANASVPTATVKPRYHAGIKLVLDLSPPIVGSGCAGKTYNGTAVPSSGCPFTTTAADGSQQIVNAIPLAPDRILLRTGGPLFWADAPIQTDVHITTAAGFLKVNLDGQLCVYTTGGGCGLAPSDPNSHLISVNLKPIGTADANGNQDVSLGGIFSLLTGNTILGQQPNPGQLVDISMHGGGSASLTATVPGVSDFFGTGATPVTASIAIGDITGDLTDTGPLGHNVAITAPDFSKLADFGNVSSDPKALFRLILQALTALDNQLQTMPAGNGGVLTTKIPLLNQSINDVLSSSDTSDGTGVTYTAISLNDPSRNFDAHWLGRTITAGTNTATVVVTGIPSGHTLNLSTWTHQPADGSPWKANSELEAAINVLGAKPTTNLQDLVTVLNGILPSTIAQAVSFTVDESESGIPKLDLHVHWDRSFSETVPAAFNFNFGGSAGQQSVVGIGSSGTLKVTAGVSAVLDVLIALTTDPSKHCAIGPGGICLGAGSAITATIAGGADNVGITATLGPVSLEAGNPGDGHPGSVHAAFNASLGYTPSVPGAGAFGLTFSDYFAGLSVSLNGNHTPSANCGTGFNPSSVPLAVCANLPLYVSSDAGHTFTALTHVDGNGNTVNDALLLRVPQATDLAGAFDLTANGNELTASGDGSTVKRFEYPTSLLTDLANSVLDLNDLSNGIDGYFGFAKNALNLASDGGKLPLVGKDLQQGADFLGDLQTRVDSVLGPTGLNSVSNVGQLQDKINNNLSSALNLSSAQYVLNAKVTATALCNSSGALQAPAIAGITNPGGSGASVYTYQVYGVTSDNTVYAPPAAGSTNSITTISPLSSTNKNHITWTANSQFATYTVVRTSTTGALTPGIIGTGVTGGAFDDTGIAQTGAAPAGTATPACDRATSLASGNLTGFTVEIKAGKGQVGDGSTPAGAGCSNGLVSDASTQCIALASVPLNIGVPGLAISAPSDGSGNLQVNLGYTFDVTFGLDKDHGFFLKTAAGDGSTVLGLGVSMNLPPTLKARIAFLQVCLANHQASPDFTANPDYPCNLTGTPPPVTQILGASFVIKLTQGANAGIVTLSELENQPLSNFFHPKLTAALNIDWDFQVDVAGTKAELPGIGGEFKFLWSWTSAATSADMGGNESGNTLEFDGIYISAGKFLSGVFKDVLTEVQTIASPLKPIIDIITAPIPLLSDLSRIAGGPDITLVTLAKAFSTVAGGPDLSFIDTIVKVVQVVNQITSYAGSGHISVGSFSLLGSGGSVFHDAYTPDTPDSGTADPEITTKSDVPTGTAAKAEADSKTGGAIGQSATAAGFGFSFPIFSHPASLFNLLMGKDVTLVQFDSGPLELGFQYSQAFGPVYAPPPVLVVIAGGASIAAHIVLGFDTFGIRTAVQNGSATLHGFLDSLFIKTTDDSGHPIPAITLTGFLAAGAEVSVLIISVGIEGGITLTINFLWHDPDNDGKLRFSEFVDNLTRGPLCLFDFSGSLNFFLKVFITIGFSIFSYTFDFTIVDITLVDFSDNHTCDVPSTPPTLGQVLGNTLYVFAGKLGGNAYRGTGWGNDGATNPGSDETIKVQQLYDNSNNPAGIGLSLIGHTQVFDSTGVQQVLIDARGYPGKENILMQPARLQTTNNSAAPNTPTPAFTLKAIVFGGNNDDTIKTGDGGSFISDGDGNDKITIGQGDSIVAVGKGKDSVKTGNGNNYVYAGAADGQALTYGTSTAHLNGIDTSVPDPGTFGHADNPAEHGAGGTAHINVGLGANHVYGGGTDAQISVASDSPLAVYPHGDTRRTCDPCTAQANFIAGGSGNNVIIGGTGGDTIYGGHQVAIPAGGPSTWVGDPGDHHDTILSNGGNATIFGGGAGNRITTKTRHGVPGHDCSGVATSNEVSCVYGGGGDNVIQGGDGDDMLYGGYGPNSHDIVRGGLGVDHLFAGDGDSILVSVSGHSILTGGAGDDYIFGGDAQFLDVHTAGNPVIDMAGYDINAGFSIDSHFGKVRSSLVPIKVPVTPGPQQVIAGNGGNNHIFASDNGDLIFGAHNRSEMVCQVQGGGHPMFTPPPENENDGGNNYIIGGLGADRITGGRGDNFIQGGGGDSFLCGGGPGRDEIHGGAGNVIVWGGSGSDAIYTEGGNDVVFGNSGNNTIYGGLGHIYVEGGSGANAIFGAQQESVLIGGSSQAGIASGSNQIISGPRNDIIVGHNGCATISTTWVPNAPPCPIGQPQIQVFDLTSGDSTLGASDTIHAQDADYRVFGGLGTSTITTGNGNSYVEGGTGNNHIATGDGVDVVIGGSSHAIDLAPHTSPPSGSTTISVGNNNDIVIGHNGCANAAIMQPWSCPPNQPVIQVFDLRSSDPAFGPSATITARDHDYRIFGGHGDSTITTGNGNSYIEGGSGNERITSGDGANVIIGGSSHAIDLDPTTPIPNAHTIITAGNGKDIVIAHNGCANNIIMGWSCPTTTSQTPPTAFGQRPYLLLYDGVTGSTIYGNGTNIHVGNGGDMVFGGLGGNFIFAGDGDNYLQGGPSDSYIEGGHGNNDIVGGNSPIGLAGTPTAALPIGTNRIYADGGVGSPSDGTNVVIGSNGLITRDDPVKMLTNREQGKPFIQRHITRLDVYDRLAHSPVRGNVNWIYGGTNDDILIGGPAGNHIFGGPPVVKGTFVDNTTCDTASLSIHDCNFNYASPAGNDYIEGGNGINATTPGNWIHAGAGDADVIGGNSDLYLDPVVDPQSSTDLLSANPNLIWGGRGNDYLLGANGHITHKIDTATGSWRVNPNDGSFVRSVFLYNLAGTAAPALGGGSHIWGENGDNHIYGENGSNWLYGGPKFDYIEGGTGSNVIQGRGGDNDIVGGNSPDSLAAAPAGQNNETIAGNLPSGSNLICGNLCGVDKSVATATAGNDVILGHNGRVGRCADGATGAHTDNDTCTWSVIPYGNAKGSNGTISSTPLGDPRQRFVDLLGQDSHETTHNGATDIEGNGGNNLIYAEDGPSVVHGGTPPGGQTADQILSHTVPTGGQPIRGECLPHQSALQGHDVIVGGYGPKVLCGGGGDDLIIGTRGDYSVVPFNGGPKTIGRAIGPIFTTVTYPASGETVYQSVDLTRELGKPVPDWQTANGFKVIFGGHGNNTIHAGPGDNFVQGADGMHIANQPPSTAGNNIIFGGFGNTSIEGGPGNDIIYGGSGNKDIDVVRDDLGVVNKLDNNLASLPPLYPTINVNPATFGITGRSYAAAFPPPAGQSYDSDPGGSSHGGTVFRTTTYGDIIYGGTGRNVMQISDEGSRMIDETGNWDLWLVCHAQYGEPNIDRSHDPALHQFVLDLASASGVTDPTNSSTSGSAEVAWAATSRGSAYPGTPGHRHCEP